MTKIQRVTPRYPRWWFSASVTGAFLVAGVALFCGCNRPNSDAVASPVRDAAKESTLTARTLRVATVAEPVRLVDRRGTRFPELQETHWVRVREAALIAGDVNCDGQVNNGDIDPFVATLNNLDDPICPVPLRDRPWCRECADVNGDGAINFADVDPFVSLITR